MPNNQPNTSCPCCGSKRLQGYEQWSCGSFEDEVDGEFHQTSLCLLRVRQRESAVGSVGSVAQTSGRSA